MTELTKRLREIELQFSAKFPNYHIELESIGNKNIKVFIRAVDKYGYVMHYSKISPYNGSITLPQLFDDENEKPYIIDF